MWQLISGLRAINPPECSVVDFSDPLGGGRTRAWTYGSLILDDTAYGHVDRHLRLLVAQCMAHSTFARPSMQTLETVILVKVGRNVDWSIDEVDPDTKTAIRDILLQPPPVPTR